MRDHHSCQTSGAWQAPVTNGGGEVPPGCWRSLLHLPSVQRVVCHCRSTITFARTYAAQRMLLNSRPLSVDLGILALRLAAGGSIFLAHGLGKLQHFNEIAPVFWDPFGLGPTISFALITFAEGICSLLVVLGVWTRVTAIPLVLGMLMAFIHDGGEGFGNQEKPFLYMVIFLAIFLLGGGRYRLDRLWAKGDTA